MYTLHANKQFSNILITPFMSLRYILLLLYLLEYAYVKGFKHQLNYLNKTNQTCIISCVTNTTDAVACPNFYIKRLFFMLLILLVHRKLFQHRQLYSFIIQAIKLLLHLGVRCLADLNIRMVRSIML